MIILSNNMSNTTLLAKNLRHLIKLAGYPTPNHFSKAFKIQSSTMSRLLGAEIKSPSLEILSQIGTALNIPWWAMFAADLTEVDPKAINWSQLATDKDHALKVNSESIDLAKDTAETLLRGLLVFHKAISVDGLSEEAQVAIAHSIGEGIIRELIKAQQASE